MSDTTVFIGGSRTLARLNADVKRRIDKIADSRFSVVVGDANGADKAAQTHLANRHYPNVTVFCVAGNCRNNVGHWPTRGITAPANARGFALYAVKDRAMAETATHGFMLWDGDSKGTLTNIITLVQSRKPVVVYFSPSRTFINVRRPEDVAGLLLKCDRNRAQRFARELNITHSLDARDLLP